MASRVGASGELLWADSTGTTTTARTHADYLDGSLLLRCVCHLSMDKKRRPGMFQFIQIAVGISIISSIARAPIV